MAKKKSKKQDLTPPANLQDLPAVFEEMGLPQGDPESMALLLQLMQSSGMSLSELFATILPALEEGGVLDEVQEVRPKSKKTGSKSKSSKKKSTAKAHDLDAMVEAALAQRSPKKTLEMLENALKLGELDLATEFRDHVGIF